MQIESTQLEALAAIIQSATKANAELMDELEKEKASMQFWYERSSKLEIELSELKATGSQES